MSENQNIEYKLIWKDEYFKQICAFANADGGVLLIGVDDKANIIGITDSHKLLESIPNKAIQFLGIIIDVNSIIKEKKTILEIKVFSNSVPISYKGKYYTRSGSTVQEVKGQELHSFILKKIGKTFDELILDKASLEDIDANSIKNFVNKAIKTNRISKDANEESIEQILENLQLITDNKKLKNAAILLFGKNPLKFFGSVSFRIGKFSNNDYDLHFQDIVEGNVFEMPDKVLDILKTRYLNYEISYEGLQRIEKLEYPEAALREAILNAIVHKDYTGVHIQLSVYNDKLVLWNEGVLPNALSIKKLKEKHPSKPRNKDIANIFFKAGYIETWGRGISMIIKACENYNIPEPVFKEIANGVQLTFYKKKDVTKDVTKDKRVSNIINIIAKKPDITVDEIAKIVLVNRRTILRDLDALLQNNVIKRIGGRKTGYWEVIK